MGTLVLQATQEEGYIISQLQGAQSKAAWSLGQSIMAAAACGQYGCLPYGEWEAESKPDPENLV